MEKRKTRETLCGLEKANVKVRWVKCNVSVLKVERKGFIKLLTLPLVRTGVSQILSGSSILFIYTLVIFLKVF